MIHKLADVQSVKIGRDTNVWQFAIILEGAIIGDQCNINCHTFIENDVKIGNRVTIKSGCFIWDGIIIEDDVFVGPNVSFTNDLRPRSKRKKYFPKTLLKRGSSIGANASILSGIKIGAYSMVGMGSVVTKDVPNYALVYGNPASIKGWVDETGEKLRQVDEYTFENKNGNKFTLNDNQLSPY